MSIFFCSYYAYLPDAKVTVKQIKYGNPSLFKHSMSNLDHHKSTQLITNLGYLSRFLFVIPLYPRVSFTASTLKLAWHSGEDAFG